MIIKQDRDGGVVEFGIKGQGLKFRGRQTDEQYVKI